MKSLVLAMRPGLDRLYLASGIGASLFLIMILALIAAQMVARECTSSLPWICKLQPFHK